MDHLKLFSPAASPSVCSFVAEETKSPKAAWDTKSNSPEMTPMSLVEEVMNASDMTISARDVELLTPIMHSILQIWMQLEPTPEMGTLKTWLSNLIKETLKLKTHLFTQKIHSPISVDKSYGIMMAQMCIDLKIIRPLKFIHYRDLFQAVFNTQSHLDDERAKCFEYFKSKLAANGKKMRMFYDAIEQKTHFGSVADHFNALQQERTQIETDLEHNWHSHFQHHLQKHPAWPKELQITEEIPGPTIESYASIDHLPKMLADCMYKSTHFPGRFFIWLRDPEAQKYYLLAFSTKTLTFRDCCIPYAMRFHCPDIHSFIAILFYYILRHHSSCKMVKISYVEPSKKSLPSQMPMIIE